MSGASFVQCTDAAAVGADQAACLVSVGAVFVIAFSVRLPRRPFFERRVFEARFPRFAPLQPFELVAPPAN